MTRKRYEQWMAVWKWFQAQKGSPELEALYGLLNVMWQEERATCTPEQLTSYSQPFTDILSDPEFQRFMQGLDRAFSKKPKPPLD